MSGGAKNYALVVYEGIYQEGSPLFIAELLRTKGAVNLFTRPRRFGKSLNMNMFRCFFEIGADASLFEGEDALPCNTQASGEHCEIKALVGLEGLAEEGADQLDHLCVITFLIGLVQGHVILID